MPLKKLESPILAGTCRGLSSSLLIVYQAAVESRGRALIAARCLSRLDFAEEGEIYYHQAGNLPLSDMQSRFRTCARSPPRASDSGL